MPVYANPAFQGCYIPRIPGPAPAADVTPTFAKCFVTPSSIVPKITATTYKSGGADATGITRTAAVLATATPVSGTEWVNYGCLNTMNTLDGHVDQTITAMNADKCIKACNADASFTFAALRVVGGVGTCQCGTGVPAGTSLIDMEQCTNPCPDPDPKAQQLCGPKLATQALVYAKGGGGVNNLWSKSWVSRFSKTPLYSCTSMSRMWLRYSRT